MCSVSEMSLNLHKTNNIIICRCCLVNRCYKDISTEYYFSGRREVYEDMLRDTFDLQLKNYGDSYANHHICEDCIARLRDAHSFKQMIVASEKKLQMFLDGIQSNEAEEPQSSQLELKLDPIKQEESQEFDTNYDEIKDDLISDGSDDEILANIKIGMDKKEKNGIVKKRKRLKMKDTGEKDIGNLKSEKNWLKIIEQRGKGPLLRDISLKLITNSTICPFQWHKSQYRCFCCKIPFTDMNLLKEHTNSSHTIEHIEKEIIQQQNCLVKVEISNIFCKLCTNEFLDLNSLRIHLNSHNIKFELEEDLLVPFKINSNNLQCQICLQSFSTFRLLNIHVNRHFQKQVCHICGAGFTNLKFLNLHKTRLHRPLQCKECNLKFNKKKEKKIHDVTVHNFKKEKKFRFPCPFCTERFFQEYLRVKHLVEKHGLKNPEHKCLMCTKVFITKSLRNNHMKNVHMKEKNRECNICHHLFYTNSDLVRHKVTHTGEKKFSCSICNNVFASKDSLRRHSKRTHVAV